MIVTIDLITLNKKRLAYLFFHFFTISSINFFFKIDFRRKTFRLAQFVIIYLNMYIINNQTRNRPHLKFNLNSRSTRDMIELSPIILVKKNIS